MERCLVEITEPLKMAKVACDLANHLAEKDGVKPAIIEFPLEVDWIDDGGQEVGFAVRENKGEEFISRIKTKPATE